mmetsp:Transcript_22890/g.52815  ORF Transcript_22890/g.52815 Transcript_22890/m.52815 type:complete len:1079 (-) Transcript_22890:1998-5234(-)
MAPDQPWPSRVPPPPTAPPIHFPLPAGELRLPLSAEVCRRRQEAVEAAARCSERLHVHCVAEDDAVRVFALRPVDEKRIGSDGRAFVLGRCGIEVGAPSEQPLLALLAAASAYLPGAPSAARGNRHSDVVRLRSRLEEEGWLDAYGGRQRHVAQGARRHKAAAAARRECARHSQRMDAEGREEAYRADRYDGAMETAVAHFQRFHGLRAGGQRLGCAGAKELELLGVKTLDRLEAHRLTSLHARVEGDADGYTLTLCISLEARAFDLDARLEVGPEAFARRLECVHTPRVREEYAAALLGDLGSDGYDARRALGALLHVLLAPPEGAHFATRGLQLGPDSEPQTLNRFCGVGGSNAEGASAADFDVGSLLHGVERRGRVVGGGVHDSGGGSADGTGSDSAGGGDLPPLVPPERLSNLRATTVLHPFQEEGVSWMAAREEWPDRLTLHPAWTQVRAADALFYLHAWSGELSRCFYMQQEAGTCGGMLCDDVGLGKSLQVLALVLARPPPPGWAVSELPARTEEPCPVKATLIVAPEALLPQWEDQVREHVRDGAITYCTVARLSSAARHQLSVQGIAAAERALAASQAEEASRPKRARKPAPKYNVGTLGGDGPEALAAAEAEREAAAETGDMEVLAATQRGVRFVGPSGGAAPPVEDCHVVLCSYEALREEVKRSEEGLFASLGFWRVVLDEAQLVENTSSQAALMCSQLWRRHAWVATGTPINAKMGELHGLLTFLGLRPFADDLAWERLLHAPYADRTPLALARMRTLLRAVMLRRSKADPAIQAQIRVPPVRWSTRELSLNRTERAAYRVAHKQLRESHAHYARVAAALASAPSDRRTALAAQQASLLGRLMGDLTRVRQMLCNPNVINERRVGGSTSALAAVTSAERQPQEVIMARLHVQARQHHDAAIVASFRARALLLAAHAHYGTAAAAELSKAHGQQTLSAELAAVAAEGLMRVPPSERQRVLAAALHAAAERAAAAEAHDNPTRTNSEAVDARTASERLAACARGTTGLEVSTAEVAAVSIGVLAAALLKRLGGAGGAAMERAAAEAAAMPNDSDVVEKLGEAPRRWLR